MSLLNINENGTVFNEALSTELAFIALPDAAVAAAIVANDPISSVSLPLKLAKGRLEAKPKNDQKIMKLSDNADLTINGSAEASLGLGIYDTLDQLKKDLQVDEYNTDKLELRLPKLGENEAYIMFSMSYGLSADLATKWAFTGGSLNVGLDGSKSKRQAVIRIWNKDSLLRSAIIDTIGSLRAVNKINGPGDGQPNLLPNQTTLLVRTDGAIEGNFGVSAGYDFNWLYKSKIRGLEGDLGIKAKLAGSLGVNMGLSGTFLLGLTNRGGNVIELQTFSKKANEWGFAASLTASVKAENWDDLTKERSAHEIIKATLGIQHAQVFKDLKKIRELVDPEKLKETVNGFTKELLQELSDSPIGTEYTEMRDQLMGLIDKWEALGSDGGAQLWKFLNGFTHDKLDELKAFIDDVSNEDKRRDFLLDKYKDIGFANSDIGKFIDDLVPEEELIDTLLDSNLFEKTLNPALDKAKEILDLDGHVKKVHEVITRELKIEKIKAIAQGADLESLGTWLTGKIESLLDATIDAVGIGEINTFIEKVEGKIEKLLEVIEKALSEEHGISLAYQYQKNTEKTALLDVSFDFTTGDEPSLSAVLNDCIKGDLKEVLRRQITGVTLNQGVLTRNVKRQSSFSITLPFMGERNFAHINDAMARNEFKDTGEGRVSLVTLDADDIRLRSHRMSEVGLDLVYQKLLKDGQADIVKKQRMKLNYAFRLGRDEFRKRHLEQITKPFVHFYLAEAFKAGEETGKGTVENWIDALQDIVQKKDGVPDKEKKFGDTLLRLSVKVDGGIGRAWFKAPEDIKDPIYTDVAQAVQARMQYLFPMFFMLGDNFYKNFDAKFKLFSLLIYKNMKPLNIIRKVKRKNRGKKKYVVKLIYNWFSEISNGMDDEFMKGLQGDLIWLKNRVKNDDDPNIANTHAQIPVREEDIKAYLQVNFNNDQGEVARRIGSILAVEAKFLTCIFNSVDTLNEFKKVDLSQENAKVDDALRFAEAFGEELTKTLNNTILTFVSSKNDFMRFLGPDLFITVAKVFDSTIVRNTTAALELMALKPQSNYDRGTFLSGEQPDKDDLILRQLIVDAD